MDSSPLIIAISVTNAGLVALVSAMVRSWIKSRKEQVEMLRNHDITLYGNPRDSTDKGLVGRMTTIEADIKEIKTNVENILIEVKKVED